MLYMAQQVADAAAAVTGPAFKSRPGLQTDVKADSSPVTEFDRQAEKAMRAVVQNNLPEHAVHGEELGFAPGSGACCRNAQVCKMRIAHSVRFCELNGPRTHPVKLLQYTVYYVLQCTPVTAL